METKDELEREREFAYTTADFRAVADLIYQRAGISLADSKQDLVYGRLSRRLRATGARSFAAYLASLDEPSNPEWEQFTNALTTNLTAFFRERHHFEMLAEYLRQHAGRGPLRLWSAAASTGEEAYSMAMTVAETLHRATDDVRILATDIDTTVINKGRDGIYTAERIESLTDRQKKQFFLRGGGDHQGKVRVAQPLRDLISFKRLNLLDAQWPMRNRFDVVFCRNVLIYFDKPTQHRLLEHIGRNIKPGGLLFIGHSESPSMDRQVFQPMGRTAYRILGPKA